MWDQRYNTEEYVYGKEPNGFLAANYQAIARGRVLCLGEGEGRNAVFLAKKGYEPTAVDSSAVGLRKAEKLARANGVEIECVHTDLADFEMGQESWQGVVSIFCHLPPALRKLVHARAAQALTPGGVFLLEAYRPEQIALGTGGPPSAELMMTSALLSAELGHLEFHHLEELERDVNEGTKHTGRAAVVQCIASKGKSRRR